MEIQAEIDEFYTRIRAKSVLIAVAWAGSATALGEIAGYGRNAGIQWVARGAISALGAVRLARVKGFPLTLNEMVPGIQVDRYVPRRCWHCERNINPPGARTESSPLLKVGRRRAKKKRLRLALVKAGPKPPPDAKREPKAAPKT